MTFRFPAVAHLGVCLGILLLCMAMFASAQSTQDWIKQNSTAPLFARDSGAAFDQDGNFYTWDAMLNSILKITSKGEILSFAGGVLVAANDGLGSSGIAFDSKGNLYFTDTDNNLIRKITPSGAISTFAGDGVALNISTIPTRDVDGKGNKAHFNQPISLAADDADNLYVTELLGNSVRKITPSGQVTTIIGRGFLTTLAAEKNSIHATATFQSLWGIAVDRPAHNIYVSDMARHTILLTSPAGGVTTLAGSDGQSGNIDSVGDKARFNEPLGLAIDQHGNVYVADGINRSIRKITPDAHVSTIAGGPGPLDDNDAVGTAARFDAVRSIALDKNDNIYVIGGGGIRKLDSAYLVTTFVGTKPYPIPLPKQPAPPPPPRFSLWYNFHDTPYGWPPANCEANSGLPSPPCDVSKSWQINHPDYFICNWGGSMQYKGPNSYCSLVIKPDRKSLTVHCHADGPALPGGEGTQAYLWISNVFEVPDDPGPGKTQFCLATSNGAGGAGQPAESCSCQNEDLTDPGVGVMVCTTATGQVTIGGACVLVSTP